MRRRPPRCRSPYSHSIVNRRALFIGKNRASLAGNRPDTDIYTVTKQCMTKVTLMTWSDETHFKADRKVAQDALTQA